MAKAITDEKIVAALVSSSTIAEAAGKVNMSIRSIYDRMAKTEFKALYEAARSDIVRTAVTKMNEKLTEAIETVSEIMNSEEANPAVRLQAAQTIITNVVKFSERLKHEEYSNITNNIQRPWDFEL